MRNRNWIAGGIVAGFLLVWLIIGGGASGIGHAFLIFMMREDFTPPRLEFVQCGKLAVSETKPRSSDSIAILLEETSSRAPLDSAIAIPFEGVRIKVKHANVRKNELYLDISISNDSDVPVELPMDAFEIFCRESARDANTRWEIQREHCIGGWATASAGANINWLDLSRQAKAGKNAPPDAHIDSSHTISIAPGSSGAVFARFRMTSDCSAVCFLAKAELGQAKPQWVSFPLFP